MPTLNPDGYSVKGCKIIYAPKGNAGEYARLAANLYRGCGHGCLYCYVPRVLRMDRKEFDAGAHEREFIDEKLHADAFKYQQLGITEQVMLSFTTDPYHPNKAQGTLLTSEAIFTLQGFGLAVCTLTKGGSRALRDLHKFRPERDAFASTLTTLDDEFSRKWEPNAALPADRIRTLKIFHAAGIFTWVSLEPVLDVASALAIVQHCAPFVDLFKIGRANYLPQTKSIDWEYFTLKMLDLVNRLGVKHYIKQDLQEYLEPGYYNPMHIPQHH